jgi:PKD repeat protein
VKGKGLASRRRSARVALAVGAVLALPTPALAAPPDPSFTYSPASPLTGEVVTFSSTSIGTIRSETWDLDGDGACNDAAGHVVYRSFPLPGSYSVKLCLNGNEATESKAITISNRPPVASFTYAPVSPVAGDTVWFTSTSADFEGPVVDIAWDLDGDGRFDDARGVQAARSFPGPGAYTVGLLVLDRDGATSIARQTIPVTEGPLRLLSPFPIVRLTGRVISGGTSIRRLGVRAPRGARVNVRCRGRGCPYRGRSVTAGARPVRFRRLERVLRPGAVLEIFVTEPGKVGKYTRFRIRAGRRPARKDACVRPGASRPTRCPSS